MSTALPTASENLPSDNEGNFFEKIIELFFDYLWIILTFALLGLLFGFFNNWRDIPQYTSYGLIKIEKADAGFNFLISDPSQNSTSLSGEVLEILTRKVLIKVVEDLNLDILIQPKLYPIIGEAWVRKRRASAELLPPPLPFPGLEAYAWGGEKYSLKTIKIPEYFDGNVFTIIADTETSFSVYNQNDILIGSSNNSAISVQVPEINDFLKIEFSEFKARPGTVFYLYKDSKIQIAEDLKKQISLEEEIVRSNVLRITITQNDPALAQRITNAIINTYMLQSSENKTEETKKQLTFIDKQLPELRLALEQAEAKLINYRKANGVQTLTPEAQDLLTQYNTISSTLARLRLQSIDIEQRYTRLHPLRLQHEKKLLEVESLLEELDKKMQNLPGTDSEFLTLERDVKVSTEVYLALLNKAQELRLIQSGILGNARTLEEALPGRSNPAKSVQKIISFSFIGVVLGFGLAFLLKSLKTRIQEADQLEKMTGKVVYASVPKSAEQAKWDTSLRKNKKIKTKDGDFILAKRLPEDPAVEAIRSLRSTLHFARLGANNNQVCILSPTPGMGKSFISVNLSYLVAETETKVLLLDTDLRKGTIHRYFQAERQHGLSDLIAGRLDFKAIKRTVNPFFDYVTSGSIPPNPSELLLNQRFHKWLESISAYYNYVIMDTAPIINVADATSIASNAAINFMVVRSDVSLIEDVKIATNRLKKDGITVNGFILNAIDTSKGRYKYGKYRNYGRYYKAYK